MVSKRREAQVVQTSYKGIKFVLLFYDHRTNAYKCTRRTFILNGGKEVLIGQFISSDWFNMEFDINEDGEFVVIGVPIEMNAETAEIIANTRGYDAFKFYARYMFSPHKLSRTLETLHNVQSVVLCTRESKDIVASMRDKRVEFSVTARIIHKNVEYTKNTPLSPNSTLGLSHPTIEIHNISEIQL